MKLIIQIPCLNEEKTLPNVISDLPKRIENIDEIEYLVIDDGSTDNTIKVARELGVHHVLDLGSNRGLAYAFAAGLKFCLKNGADIVVNTDGDNQYNGADIALLVKPILERRADIVVGNRPIINHAEFSPIKKLLQLFGSWTLRLVSNTKVKDAPSGFRAFSKEACYRLNIYSRFSYTMETLIQAGNSNLRVDSVNIRVNPKTRESRLFKNMLEHVRKSAITIFNLYLLYRPGRFLFIIGSFFNLIAFLIGARFVYLVYIVSNPNSNRTYLPSLILLAIFAFFGTISYFMGILGELMKATRKLSEDIIANQREILYSKKDK